MQSRKLPLVLLATTISGVSFAGDYIATDLGIIGHGNFTKVSISNSGLVAGYSQQGMYRWNSGSKEFFSSPDYALVPLSINSAGTTVGYAVPGGSGTWPAMMVFGTSISVVQGPNGLDADFGSVNESGLVVGRYFRPGTGGPFATAAVFDSGTWTALPLPLNSRHSQAMVVNSAGTIVGRFTNASGEHPVAWANGSYTVLARPNAAITNNFASHVNDSGDVIVQAITSYDSMLGRTYLLKNGSYTELRTPGNLRFAVGGMNSAGVMIGSGVEGSLRDGAWLRTAAGQYISFATILGSSSVPLGFNPTDINDNGQIVGYAIDGGVIRHYLVSPVPEPASFCVLGLGALTLLRRRRVHPRT